MKYRIVCTSTTTCEGVQIRFTTLSTMSAQRSGGRKLTPREDTVALSGALLAGGSAGNGTVMPPVFTCPVGSPSPLPSSMTMLSNVPTAVCTAFPGFNALAAPVPSFLGSLGSRAPTGALYKTAENVSCTDATNKGLGKAGALIGYSSCKSAEYEIGRECSALPEFVGGYKMNYRTTAPVGWELELNTDGTRKRSDGGSDPNAGKTCTIVTASNNTFIIPNGVTEIFAQLWGAGGGGGKGAWTSGGAAGAYVAATVPVALGADVATSIGAGGGATSLGRGNCGTAEHCYNHPGGKGGDTILRVNGAVKITAQGGAGGRTSHWSGGPPSAPQGGSATIAADVSSTSLLKGKNGSVGGCNGCAAGGGASPCPSGNFGFGNTGMNDDAPGPGWPGRALITYVRCI